MEYDPDVWSIQTLRQIVNDPDLITPDGTTATAGGNLVLGFLSGAGNAPIVDFYTASGGEPARRFAERAAEKLRGQPGILMVEAGRARHTTRGTTRGTGL